MSVVEHLEVGAIQQAHHLLTFDVEHWYEGFRYRGIDGWQVYPPRDDKMVELLLDKLGEAGQRSTMFFTGRYAEEFPHVIRRAAQEGHEVASHSYSHMVLSKMGGIDGFRVDLLRSVSILEDIAGCKIKGYRAPKWSVFDLSYLEVLNVLHEAGLEYDSSVFPKIFDGSRTAFPHQVDLGNRVKIWEVPATTYPIFGLRVPVAGGVYFRFFPPWVTRKALLSCQSSGQPSVIYLHPYDLDASCPRLLGGSPLFQRLRYYGVDTALDRLDVMLRRYKFGTMLDWVKHSDRVSPVEEMELQ